MEEFHARDGYIPNTRIYMAKFYAIDKDIPNVVAVFNTEQERDDWVLYKDYEILHLPPEEEEYKSCVAITYEEAYNITEGLILYEYLYFSDEFFDHIKYCTNW